jgi:hypothetical protein
MLIRIEGEHLFAEVEVDCVMRVQTNTGEEKRPTPDVRLAVSGAYFDQQAPHRRVKPSMRRREAHKISVEREEQLREIVVRGSRQNHSATHNVAGAETATLTEWNAAVSMEYIAVVAMPRPAVVRPAWLLPEVRPPHEGMQNHPDGDAARKTA